MVGDFLARFAAIPLSYLALMFSILPLLALRAIWRRRKLARIARLGLCGKCGYDLRAHASGEKCPECETVVGPKAESRK